MADETNISSVESEQTAEPTVDEPKKRKKAKKVRTPQQKRKRRIIAWSIVGGIVLILGIFVAVAAIINAVGVKALLEQAASYEKVAHAEQLTPQRDDNGYTYFETDRDFKVMQITDVHIGAGFSSFDKDAWALNAVAHMITQEKPDLVIVTGDISFPVPSSGTLNNLNAFKIFTTAMESLGVYWTFAFGNHDTEAYSYYTRKQISDYVEGADLRYCLYRANNDKSDKKAAEDFGYGNDIIKIKDKNTGLVTQALVLFDSHSYTGGDIMGVLWKYDNIHQSQVDWYAQEMAAINKANRAIDPTCADVKNCMFFHIPLREFREAWSQYETNGYQSTEDALYLYGRNGEWINDEGERTTSMNPFVDWNQTYGICCGMGDDQVFETGKQNGLQGVFCGHDHLNNFSFDYKGVRLTYGMSIDYLAYSGIWQKHSQRGSTVITYGTDGSFDYAPRNYYTDYHADYEYSEQQ